MNIHLRRVAFGVGEGDFITLLHKGANRNRQLVEVVASALVNLAIFQGQAVTARDQYQNFSFCCHVVLLFEIKSVLQSAQGRATAVECKLWLQGIRTSTTTHLLVVLSMSERVTV